MASRVVIPEKPRGDISDLFFFSFYVFCCVMMCGVDSVFGVFLFVLNVLACSVDFGRI